MYETLELTIDDDLARLTLNRRDKLNAIDETMLAELDDALVELDGDADAKAVALSGAGERAFSADLDWSESMTGADRVAHGACDAASVRFALGSVGPPGPTRTAGKGDHVMLNAYRFDPMSQVVSDLNKQLELLERLFGFRRRHG